jgi:cell wall-associated NlpC family hydrolase
MASWRVLSWSGGARRTARHDPASFAEDTSRMTTIFDSLRAALFLPGLLLAACLPSLCAAADLPPLKTGDIVFQNTSGSASEAIMLASGTDYTHVGIVEIDKAGRAQVIEAAGPVRVVALQRWISNGNGKLVTVKRVKGLAESDAKAVVARARKYLGRPYDHFYYDTRDQIYCSELVYAAFREGPNITLGVEEKVRSLNIDTKAAQTIIAQRWRSHPLCKERRAKSFDACYALILEQTLVTPVSIARDAKLETIYTSFGAGAE